MNDQKDGSSIQRSLISRTTILLLTGCLFTFTVRDIATNNVEGFKFCAYVLAIVAVIAYIGLDKAAKRRTELAKQRAEEVAVRRLELGLKSLHPDKRAKLGS